ncbi:hypothetical protein DSO57_1011645 [Entomophthora muscae]|uniref:Uncharacterized protein n=1 Tax=Entomophthora muscae TaxID=34485 RepID=A0ACC2RKZ3_9FUNG|nr:hypothetical protein DSO57_1011645 [Entomophthora muscae]
MILHGGYLVLALDSLSGLSHPPSSSSCVITNHVHIIIHLLNIFPCVNLLEQHSYNNDHIKDLVNCIIDIQATSYTSAYKNKMLEISPDNTRRSSLPEFNIGDHILYYQHRVEGRTHKLDMLWVGSLEVTFKQGSEYTVKLLSSCCPFA